MRMHILLEYYFLHNTILRTCILTLTTTLRSLKLHITNTIVQYWYVFSLIHHQSCFSLRELFISLVNAYERFAMVDHSGSLFIWYSNQTANNV